MKKEHVYCKNCTRDVGIKMERRRGFNLRYTGGGDPLCTAYIEQKDCTARFAT